jgi:hypothetical protein
MKNILCQSAKHAGLWSIAPQQPVLATIGGTMSSGNRGLEFNYDASTPGGFIEGWDE